MMFLRYFAVILRHMHAHNCANPCRGKALDRLIGPLGSACHVHHYPASTVLGLTNNYLWSRTPPNGFCVFWNPFELTDHVLESNPLLVQLIKSLLKKSVDTVVCRGMATRPGDTEYLGSIHRPLRICRVGPAPPSSFAFWNPCVATAKGHALVTPDVSLHIHHIGHFRPGTPHRVMGQHQVDRTILCSHAVCQQEFSGIDIDAGKNQVNL